MNCFMYAIGRSEPGINGKDSGNVIKAVLEFDRICRT